MIKIIKKFLKIGVQSKIEPKSEIVISENTVDIANVDNGEDILSEKTTKHVDSPKVENTNHKILSAEEKSNLIESLALKKIQQDESHYKPSDLDPLFEDAARLIISSQMGSTSLLQRRMKLGYNRSGQLMDQLEAAGVVGPNSGSKAREVLLKNDIELENFLKDYRDGNYLPFRHFYEENKLEIEARAEELLQMEIDENTRKEKNLIRQELLEKERKKQLQRLVLKELIDEGAILNDTGDKSWKREPIPQDVMDKVWVRDGGKCVSCGSQKYLEFDHIIPFSKGGASTYRNLQILCKECNIEKSNNIG